MIGMASLISSTEMLNDCMLKCVSLVRARDLFISSHSPGEYLSIWNMISPV